MCTVVAYRRASETTGKLILPSSSLHLKFLQYTHPIKTPLSTPKKKYANTIHPHTINSALIRRVQAVVHVKREDSDDDAAENVLGASNDEASDEDEIASSNQRRSSRRSRKIIKDDEENVEQDYLAADGNPVRDLRHRINYREEDEDEDDVDELMMGAEVHKNWLGYLCLSDIYTILGC